MGDDRRFCPAYWGMFFETTVTQNGLMNPGSDDTSAESAAFADLLVESGLVSHEQLTSALLEHSLSGVAIDAVLVAQGVVEPVALRSVLAHAWNLPALNLARTHVDHELVDQFSDELYLSENWFPGSRPGERHRARRHLSDSGCLACRAHRCRDRLAGRVRRRGIGGHLCRRRARSQAAHAGSTIIPQLNLVG